MNHKVKPCRSYVDSIDRWLARALPEAEERRLREHLESCAACRRWSNDLAEISQMLRDYPKISTPDSFDSALRARLKQDRGQASAPAWRFSTFRYGALAASLIIVILVTVWVTQVSRSGEQAAAPKRLPTAVTSPYIVVKTADGQQKVIELPPQIELKDVNAGGSYAYLMETSH